MVVVEEDEHRKNYKNISVEEEKNKNEFYIWIRYGRVVGESWKTPKLFLTER